MKISELIKELEKFKKEEGDIRVVIFNDTIAEMIWNKEQYNEEDAWEDIVPCVEYTQDNRQYVLNHQHLHYLLHLHR